MANPTDQVRFDILIEAQASLKSLQMLLRATESNERKIIEFSRVVMDASRAWGVSWQQALNVYKQLNAELSKGKKSTVFGNVGGKDLFKGTEGYIQSLEQSKRVQTEVAAGAEQMGAKVNSATGRMTAGVHIFRIALGVIASQAIFGIEQAFSNMVRKAISNLRQLEETFYRITQIERMLSKEGIEISVEGLKAGIEDIQKMLPIFSKEDVAQMVGALSLATKEAGYTEEQILKLSKAAAILNINSAANEDLLTTQSHLVSAILGKASTGVSQLGVSFNQLRMQAKGVELGFLEIGEAAEQLTEKERYQVKYSIVLDAAGLNEAGANFENLQAYLKTTDAQFKILSATWNDFLTDIAELAGPLIVEVLEGIIQTLQTMNDWLNENREGITSVVNAFAFLLDQMNNFRDVQQEAKDNPILQEAIDGLYDHILRLTGPFGHIITIVKTTTERLTELRKSADEFVESISKSFPTIKKWYELIFGKTEQTYPETPTGTPTGLDESQAKEQGDKYREALSKAEEDIQDAMQDARDKRLDIERDYQRKLEDIATDTNNKMADLATDVARKREDALRDYTQKVEDIERDTNQAIEDAQADARKKQEDAEAEHQQRLKELRQKFLFDLEDALHERDARQVLRLIRQYKFDKENLDERHKLQQEESKQNLQIKIQELQQEKQLKLDAARREYEEKLTDIAIGEKREKAEIALWKSRQLQDARLWHSRQLQENREYLQRRLRDIAAALAQELQINQQTAQSLVSMWGSAAGAMQQIGNVMVSPSGATQVVGSGAVTTWNGGDWGGYSPGNVANIPGFAEGGSLIATKPTKAIFGEDGPERVDFTPIGRTGKNVGRVFGGEGMGGMGGTIDVMLTLSPDLEARIVDTSLENVALHFEKLDRSK